MIYQKNVQYIFYNQVKVQDMKYIFWFIIIFSIYKSCGWNFLFHEWVIEIIFNNKIQIFFFSNQFIFLKEKN